MTRGGHSCNWRCYPGYHIEPYEKENHVSDQKPSVGRIVHYVSYGTPGGEYSRECRAAVVTEVDGQNYDAGLCVLNPTGQFFNRGVHYRPGEPDNAGGTNLCDGLDFPGGTWHWPARV